MEKNILTALALLCLATLVSCTPSRPHFASKLPAPIYKNTNIAVLLPLHGKLGSAGKQIRAGFLSAFKEHSQEQGTPIGQIRFYNVANQAAHEAYQIALQNGARVIAGPLSKNHVNTLSELGSYPVPTLALNYSDSHAARTNYYEFGLSPENEAKQTAIQANRNGYRNAIVIASNDQLGKRMADAFHQTWEHLGGTITDAWFYSKRRSTFAAEMAALLKVDPKAASAHPEAIVRRDDVDVIFLFAGPNDARLIVPLLKYYNADTLPVYAASSIYSGTPNPEKDADLNGVTICDMPWRIQMAASPTNEDSAMYDKLYALGRDAYSISQILSQPNPGAYFPFNGATGTLMLSSDHKIYQQLTCVKMRHGHL